MKKIYFVWTLIIVLLLSVVTFIGFKVVNKNKIYKNLENDMEVVVSKYLGQYIEEYPKNGSKTVKIADVIDKGYELNMNINDDMCDGYVVVKKVSIAYEYDGYIKCNNYVTKGYSE